MGQEGMIVELRRVVCRVIFFPALQLLAPLATVLAIGNGLREQCLPSREMSFTGSSCVVDILATVLSFFLRLLFQGFGIQEMRKCDVLERRRKLRYLCKHFQGRTIGSNSSGWFIKIHHGSSVPSPPICSPPCGPLRCVSRCSGLTLEGGAGGLLDASCRQARRYGRAKIPSNSRIKSTEGRVVFVFRRSVVYRRYRMHNAGCGRTRHDVLQLGVQRKRGGERPMRLQPQARRCNG